MNHEHSPSSQDQLPGGSISNSASEIDVSSDDIHINPAAVEQARLLADNRLELLAINPILNCVYICNNPAQAKVWRDKWRQIADQIRAR